MNDTNIKNCQQSRLKLSARLEESQRQYNQLHTQVSEKQTRVEWSEEVRDILLELNEKEHEREVGTFEKLLTSCLEDVLPGYREVVMDLHTFNGLPALDLFIKKGINMPLEDALHGTGQSVTNILSLGLRAISIMRSKKRRFMILDEADCWVREEYAPKFTHLVNQLATGLGFQILMISHKPEWVFEKIPHIACLEKHADGITAQWLPTSETPVWEEGQKGLRSIFLEDFMSHTATYLPLAPGLTVLFGDNDIGKSAIITGFRAVFLGEGNETQIHHYQNSARISLNFGPENTLQWTRLKKGSIKESFVLLDAEQTPLQTTNSAKKTPTWVSETFQIGLIDGLDIQLRNQSEPIFLLNQPATTRAKALSIGNDGGHVQTMMALDKAEVAEAKAFVKQGEKQLEQLRRIIHVITPIFKTEDHWKSLERRTLEIQKNEVLIMELEELAETWAESQGKKEILEEALNSPLIEEPQFESNQELIALAERWKIEGERMEILSSISNKPQTLIPEINLELPSQEALATRWKRATQFQKVLSTLDDVKIEAPENVNTSEQLEVLMRKWSLHEEDKNKSESTLHEIEIELVELSHSSAICNTCGQLWTPEHLDVSSKQ